MQGREFELQTCKNRKGWKWATQNWLGWPSLVSEAASPSTKQAAIQRQQAKKSAEIAEHAAEMSACC